MSAPDILLLTPNGRFELQKRICIDGLTSFHAGSWQPAWGVRTAILGLRSFWMQGGEALSAIGALDCGVEERTRLARLSRRWECGVCKVRNEDLLRDRAKVEGEEGSKLGDTKLGDGVVVEMADEGDDLRDNGQSPELASAPSIPLDVSIPSTLLETGSTTIDQVTPVPAPRTGPLPTRTATLPIPSTAKRRTLVWLDAAMAAMVFLLAILIVRRASMAMEAEL